MQGAVIGMLGVLLPICGVCLGLVIGVTRSLEKIQKTLDEMQGKSE